ncbi:MAG: hypothetical protein HRT47_11360 [Candidatus Caenarcaniphilales bacterium]|nr:hypothetical protein [Candidatus Caenarcaniphilales bacterium]
MQVKNYFALLANVGFISKSLFTPATLAEAEDPFSPNSDSKRREKIEYLSNYNYKIPEPINYTDSSHRLEKIKYFYQKVHPVMQIYSNKLNNKYSNSNVSSFVKDALELLRRELNLEPNSQKITYEQISNINAEKLSTIEKEFLRILIQNWTYVDPSFPNIYPQYPSSCALDQIKNDADRPIVLILDHHIDGRDYEFEINYFQANQANPHIETFEGAASHAMKHAQAIVNNPLCPQFDYADKTTKLPENIKLSVIEKNNLILKQIREVVHSYPHRPIIVSISRLDTKAMIDPNELNDISAGATQKNYHKEPHRSRILNYIDQKSMNAFLDIELLSKILTEFPNVKILMAVGNNNKISGYKLAQSNDGRRPIIVCSEDENGNKKLYNKQVNDSCDLSAYDEIHTQVIKDPKTGKIYLDFDQDQKADTTEIPQEIYAKMPLGKNPKDILLTDELLQDLQILKKNFTLSTEYQALLKKYGVLNREQLFEKITNATQGMVLSTAQQSSIEKSPVNNSNSGNNFYEINKITMDGQSAQKIKTVKIYYRKYKVINGALSYYGEGSSYAKPIQKIN